MIDQESISQIGSIFGAIALIGIPLGVVCYKVSMVKFKNKTAGILGAIACLLVSIYGGFLYGLPTLGMCLILAKFSAITQEEELTPVNAYARKSNLVELRKLQDLKEKGALSEKEYQDEKSKVLTG